MDNKIESYLAIKKNISALLHTKSEIDICDFYQVRVGGIGYSELRYCSLGSNGQLFFESNNVHDWSQGDDIYCKLTWNDLTNYERDMLTCIFTEI